MKKLLIPVLITITMSLYAAVPVQPFDTTSVFRSPARLADAEEKRSFGFELDGSSNINGILFASDPVSALQGGADYLGTHLVESDDSFLASNYEMLCRVFSFDGNFPTAGRTDAETAYFLREYFGEGGGYEEIGDANKALAVADILSANPQFFRNGLAPSDAELSLKFYGGSIRNGFGWDWNVSLGFDGAEDLLYQYSSGNHRYGNDIYLTVGSDIGYGRYVTDNVAVGFSVTPRIMFQTAFTDSDYLAARLDSSILNLFASNRYNLGIGIGLNAGVMYRVNDELSFVLDLRDVPSARTYWYFTADDVMNDFRMHYDDTLYLTPPDAALSMLWERGKYHVSVEISDALSQVIWANTVSGYDYDPWIIPKIGFVYDLYEDLTLSAKLEYRRIKLGVDWNNFNVELSSRLDELNFGIKVGYFI